MLEYVKRLLVAIIFAILICIFIISGTSLANAEENTLDLNWLWPSDGYISDIFGTRNGRHKGIDIASEIGTEVIAVEDGTVTRSYYSKTYGNVVFIQHKEGYETVYAHLKARKVKQGEHVKKGEIIGLIGSTGNSSGPHLHFEVHKNEWTIEKQNAIDPFFIFGEGEIGQMVFKGETKIEPSVEVARKVKDQITHTVHQGETLWSISNEYDLSIDLIKKLNHLKSDRIFPNQVLIIKDKGIVSK